MWEIIVKSFDVLIFVAVLAMWFFFAWGLVRAWLSNKPEYAKDIAHLTKTRWVITASAALFVLVGAIRVCVLFVPAWGYFVFAIVLAAESYSFKRTIDTLSKE